MKIDEMCLKFMEIPDQRAWKEVAPWQMKRLGAPAALALGACGMAIFIGILLAAPSGGLKVMRIRALKARKALCGL